MKNNKIFYRGDPNLKQKAKAQAAIEGKSLGQWIDGAIREKLERAVERLAATIREERQK